MAAQAQPPEKQGRRPGAVFPAATYLDTSGLYAVFDADDSSHEDAATAWQDLIASETVLYTTDYVLVELTALLRRRLGVDAVDALTTHVLPWVDMLWVDKDLHAQAVAGLLGARRREVSLVDYVGFTAMRSLGLRHVFAFDAHFTEQGFTVIP